MSQSTNYTYIDRGHMLRDNALKFHRDQVYVIPQKPIENGQYINKNGGHFENLRNSYYIDIGHMLWDHALKFDRDHNYINLYKPIENGQYINQNDLLVAILKIREILDGDHMLHLGNRKW